jgi:RNA polymerase sigma factor (sigma-70 family)
MIDDKTLWNKFRKGEHNALSCIYSQYVNILFQYGMKFTSNRDLVMDSIHDLFENLLRSHKSLGDTDNIQFYLLRSLRRQLTKNIKQQTLFNNQLQSEDIAPKIEFAIEERIISGETTTEKEQKIAEALKKLSPRLREILYYKYTCNFDYEQICELMSVQYDSARKMVSRALKALKKTLSSTLSVLFFLHLPKIFFQKK